MMMMKKKNWLPYICRGAAQFFRHAVVDYL